MNTFFYNRRGRNSVPGGLWATADNKNLKKFSVVLYIYFNSFISFISFRGVFIKYFQCITTINDDKNNHNEDIFNHNEDIFNHNEDKNNLVMMTKIIYNQSNDDIF